MLVRVKVLAGAKKEKLSETGKEKFTISVREPAERNLANMRVRELMAKHFKVPVSSVRIMKGHHRAGKLISISDGFHK